MDASNGGQNSRTGRAHRHSQPPAAPLLMSRLSYVVQWECDEKTGTAVCAPRACFSRCLPAADLGTFPEAEGTPVAFADLISCLWWVMEPAVGSRAYSMAL